MSPESVYYSREEIARHMSPTDCWMIIKGRVYNVTPIVETHPGGSDCLFDCAGVDATTAFDDVGHSQYAWEALNDCYLGLVENDPNSLQDVTENRPPYAVAGCSTIGKNIGSSLISKRNTKLKSTKSSKSKVEKSLAPYFTPVQIPPPIKFETRPSIFKIIVDYSRHLKTEHWLIMFLALLSLGVFVHLQYKKWDSWSLITI
ncbi:hypothetical protein DAMA08_023700 [Martiniozyma asiatica (nom. inval.)]|nr:hypothetical protein DAMA08_023700 [Martiniozyma asiatica]